MFQQSSAPVKQVVHHKHDGAPNVTYFDSTLIQTSGEVLTLIIRTDANHATRDLQAAFRVAGHGTTLHANGLLSPATLKPLIESAYKAWGHAVVAALAKHIDYGSAYGIEHPDARYTNIHFHTADSLAGSVIRQTEALIQKERPGAPAPVYVSLDDMIDAHIFREYARVGSFAEIGFSRLFSHAGEELCFVGRPQRAPIDVQIDQVRAQLKKLQNDAKERVPVVLLEDNVRRAKTLLWIFDHMTKGGVFEHGELAAIGTCFSVATDAEPAKICHEGNQIPLIVGMNYEGSPVDVITPRDHLFDGLVVKKGCGNLGRLPSFLLPDASLARNFKIRRDEVQTFRHQIIEAGQEFCATLENNTGIAPTLDFFTTGCAIADTLGVPSRTSMASILEQAKKRQSPLRIISQ